MFCSLTQVCNLLGLSQNLLGLSQNLLGIRLNFLFMYFSDCKQGGNALCVARLRVRKGINLCAGLCFHLDDEVHCPLHFLASHISPRVRVSSELKTSHIVPSRIDLKRLHVA